MSEYNTKDALGNEIVFGGYYGYSLDSSGHTQITIGRALNFTKTGLLSLEVIKRSSGIYNYELKEDKIDKGKASVKPSRLFPIYQKI